MEILTAIWVVTLGVILVIIGFNALILVKRMNCPRRRAAEHRTGLTEMSLAHIPRLSMTMSVDVQVYFCFRFVGHLSTGSLPLEVQKETQ